MLPLHFAARHVYTLRTHPTIGEDTNKRKWFKTGLGNLADTGPRITYDQAEYRANDFITEVTLDTGPNESRRVRGDVIELIENEGDAYIRQNLRLPTNVEYEVFPS
jgi:hypothetical protein